MLEAILLAAMLAREACGHDATACLPEPSPAAQQTAEDQWPPAGVYRPGKGATMPQVLSDANPFYTVNAMRNNIEGLVALEAIVLPDGSVGEIRVTRSLDRQYGLDDQAVSALKKWRFAPGTKDGVAVPVVVQVELTFTIRRKDLR